MQIQRVSKTRHGARFGLLLAGTLFVSLGALPAVTEAQLRIPSNYVHIANSSGVVWQKNEGRRLDRTKGLADTLTSANSAIRSRIGYHVRRVYMELMPLYYHGQKLRSVNNISVTNTDDNFSIRYRQVSNDVVSFTFDSSAFNLKAKLVSDAGTWGWPRLNRDLDVHGRYRIIGRYNVMTGRVSTFHAPQLSIGFIKVRTRKIDGDQKDENRFLQTVFLGFANQIGVPEAISGQVRGLVVGAFRAMTQATNGAGFAGAVVHTLMKRPPTNFTNVFAFTQQRSSQRRERRELVLRASSNISATVGHEVTIENIHY